MTVLAFHGQYASGGRLRADMGEPEWVDAYPDWQDRWQNAQQCSEELLSSGLKRLVAVGYSLGGDYIARLTWERVGDFLKGIVLYEAPLITLPCPRPVGCPVLQIWNNYVPRSEKRREGKGQSIARWSLRFPRTTNLVGRYRGHVLWAWRPPFIRHAWDRSLNRLIGDWINALP